MKRKIISLLLCAVMVSGSMSALVIAETKPEEPQVSAMAEDRDVMEAAPKADNPSEKALEAAIKAAKAKIQIPKEYSEFNYSYYGTNSSSGIYWSLSWSNPKDYSYIDVSLDRDNNLIHYYSYDYSKNNRSIPNYLKSELQDEAEAFIKKVASDIYSKLDFVEASYGGLYSNTYTYRFQRKENNVIFPDNSVTVGVDAATGEVRSASIEWLRGAKIPSSSVKLSKEDAAGMIGDKLTMKLSYKMNYYRIADSAGSKQVKKAFLVYEPDLGYISVDADTGEIYLTKSEWREMNSDDLRGEESANKVMDTADGNMDAGVLTDEEIAKIRELENLISKDKAIDIVTSNSYLYIDKNLLTYTANLNKSYMGGKESSYVWNITLRDSRPVDYDKDEDYFRAYANAAVDAKSGKILSFNANVRNSYDRNTGKWLPVEIKYDREYGKETFEKFLNSQVKDRFNKTKLVEQTDDYVAYHKENNEPVYGGYSYRYNRFNEGIEFIYNGINGSVDGVTGKIYNYNVNWDDDIIFESPKNAMTAKEAFNHYISKDGYNLLYEINIINQYDPNYKSKDRYYDYSEVYSAAYEVRLVYRPDINPAYISPFTGEQLNYSGEVYKDAKPYVYNDITDTKENRDILLLSDMNIGFDGGSFSPDKLITEGEISMLIEKLGYWYDESEAAKESAKLITREEMAYSFIKRLGLEKIAKIKGIYTTGYADESTINQNYLGAVALAKGLKLFPMQEGDYFNPKNNISRREAVTLLLNFVKASNENY